ncbi:MAG: phenylacetate--CoA ligase family protein [Sporichthyaceae bacterium]
MAELEQLRAAHMARAQELAPEFLSRLQWDTATLAEHRKRALRDLMATALDRSPWHRKRLKGIDLDALDPDDLTGLPVMTKAELMAEWDEIVTDDRLRLADVDAHLEHGDGGYLFDEYTALATGGSTGRRGVTVYDRDGFATLWLSGVRRLMIDRTSHPQPGAMSMAWVMAAHPSHASAAMARTFHNPAVVSIPCPVTWPLEKQVAVLNETAPTVLAGFPSSLALLAHEAMAGRLRIAPARIVVSGEPLLPELRALLEAVWAVPVCNVWGATEVAILGAACRSARMHLAQDLGIVEIVGAAGRPVPPGATGAKIYATNLFNHALPTIRYEITDEIAVQPDPCPCGETTPTVADVQGRLDDTFRYADRIVHPHVFRSAFSRRTEILEYQVRQTARGAEVDLCLASDLELARIEGELVEGLRGLGVPDPEVTVRQVDRVGRLEHTGKLKRFVPLAAS